MNITDQESFEAFIDRADSSSVLAIDTEFLREKTYYAQLCLIQLATDDEIALVDPFAVDDIKAIIPLFTNENIVKVFHAAGQDLSIFYHEIGILPHPIFDTQMAAALLGQSYQIGYGALVKAICGVSLKKTDSYTDWSRRPLSSSQIEYATDDVAYLPRLYHEMVACLEQRGRLHWLDRDFGELVRPDRYEEDPHERFRHLKRANQLTPHQLAAACEAAAWREEQARQRNIPVKRILSDEQIVDACKRDASTIDELFMVRGVRERLGIHDARTLAARMKAGFDLPPEKWPELNHVPQNETNVDAEVDLMSALVCLRAKENDIAMQTLASHADLVSIARGYREDIDVLRDWRRDIIGNELLDLVDGRIGLCFKDSQLSVIHL